VLSRTHHLHDVPRFFCIHLNNPLLVLLILPNVNSLYLPPHHPRRCGGHEAMLLVGNEKGTGTYQAHRKGVVVHLLFLPMLYPS
jgi:hypothetical protein